VMSFEEAQACLDAAMDALPEGIFRELNGGVILSHDAPMHPQDIDGTLRVMGRYVYEPAGLGRYVLIYYGSFCTLYGHRGHSFWQHKLTEVLHHELTHHLESLAGDRSLEIEDERFIRSYYAGREGEDTP